MSQLMDPKKLYAEQKDEFVKHIKDKNLIDYYKLTFDHYIEQNQDPLSSLKDKLRKESYEWLENLIGTDKKMGENDKPELANDI